MKRPALLCVALGVLCLVTVVNGGQTTVKRTVLQQVDLSVPGREAVTAIVELPPGSAAGRHTHPGEEIGYVLEGTVFLEREGMPAISFAAGQTFLIPAGIVHNATNKMSTPARVLANYIVEKGKPLVTPAVK